MYTVFSVGMWSEVPILYTPLYHKNTIFDGLQ